MTHTQPDISYAVSIEYRHMDKPHEIHWMEEKIISRFVQGTKTHGIHYVAQSSLELVGFTDCDWEADNTNRKSNYEYMLAYIPIIWSSKNQCAISLSSTEAEYRGAMNVATQCLWLQGILGEFGIESRNSIVIFVTKKVL